MKKTLLLTGLSLFGFVVCLSEEVQAQFGQVQPYEDNIVVEEPQEGYQEYLVRAVRIHNLQFRLNTLVNLTYPVLKEYIAKYDLTSEQIAALDECATTALEKYFNEPHNDTKVVHDDGSEEYLPDGKLHTVYDNLRQDFEERLGKLTVTINAVGDANEEDSADAFPYWRIGRAVLMDFYENPSKYGSVKAPFPLWTDQKFLYTQKITDITNNIKKLFWINGIDQSFNNGMQLKISDLLQPGTPYVYLTFNTLKQKYNNLLTYLQGHPNYNNLKSKLVSASDLPQPPTTPLPPFYEIIQLKDDPAQTGTMFPEWPGPWAEYIRRGLSSERAASGEMDTVFMPNTITLRPAVRNWDSTKINNRLSLRKELDDYKANIYNAYKQVLTSIDETLAEVAKGAAEIGITVQPYEDAIPLELNQDETEISATGERILRTYLAYRDVLVEEKKAAIAEAQRLYKMQTKDSNPKNTSIDNSLGAMAQTDPSSSDYSELATQMNAAQTADDEQYLNDLLTDVDGLAIQAPLVTNDAKANYESALAQFALQRQAYDKSKEEIDEFWSRLIDHTCINSGVGSPEHRGQYIND